MFSIRAYTLVASMISLVWLNSPYLFASTSQYRITFDRPNVTLEKRNGYDTIHLKDCVSIGKVGSPQLPVKPLTILLPPDAAVQEIRVLSVESEVIEGNFSVYPAQYPAIPGEQKEFAAPNHQIYRTDQPYPSQLVELTSSGWISGYYIVNALVYPFQHTFPILPL